ncbi:MAG: SRPBCC family protein [Nitrospirota bacterium]
MFKIIALVVVFLIVALLVFAASKPDTFGVQRSASINAPPEKIFALINDFHSWGAWSPYEKLDPTMKRTYSGAANGKGSVYEWEGSGKVGVGRMEISETSPPSKVTLELDFVKPFKAHNVVDFTLKPTGDSTNVTWAMHGRTPYMAKVVHVFFDMDSMVGKDFEAGLANLKTIVEK